MEIRLVLEGIVRLMDIELALESFEGRSFLH
jgi:hypothetical protein